MKKIIILFFIATSLHLQAQNFKIVNGSIKDSAGQPLITANITLCSVSDTFHTLSNEKGEFQFNNVKKNSFFLIANIMGYQSWKHYYNYADTLEVVNIDIIMQIKTSLLNEVVVKGNKPLVISKEDTLEYHVSQFNLKENAIVEDLLKRIPGLEVDINGNILFMGQPITKIKINGQEIQVNNIQTLTRLIPTDLLEKIQIIDDYGEFSTITGRKTEKPTHVLNLQSKSNFKQAYQLTGTAGMGSSERYNTSLLGSYLSPQEQLFLYSNNNNIYGVTQKQNLNNAGITYTKKYKNWYIGTNINWEKIFTNITTSSLSTIINSEGNLYNNIQNKEQTENNNRTLYLNGQYKSASNNQINISLRGSLANNKSNSFLECQQTGIQDLFQTTSNITNNYIPTFDGSILFSHPLKKKGRIYSERLVYFLNQNNNNLNSNNHTLFKNTDGALTDSLSHLLIQKPTNQFGLNYQTSWIEPINKLANIELKYTFKYNNYNNSLLTYSNDSNYKNKLIDSLSNLYSYKISNNEIEISIKNEFKSMKYIIGGRATFYKLYNESQYSNNIIHGFTFSPIIKIYYKINTSSLSLLCDHYLTYPSYQQIQSIPDKTNILFPVIGNPNLKASATTRIIAELRHVGDNILFITTTAEFTKRNISTNTINILDTLGVITQETYFLNTNGNYSLSIQYGWNRIFNKIFSLSLDGGESYSINKIYLDNDSRTIQNLLFSSSIKAQYLNPIIELTGLITHTFSRNIYKVPEKETTNIQSLNFQLNGKISYKSWEINFTGNKQINSGFSGSIAENPFILNAAIEKKFIKNKLTCRLQGHNLSNEVNNASQIITGNTITETKTSILGTYFLLSLAFDLRKVNTH